ncbi:hypothetical protein SI65_03597 [Aspergillus cristatus]|uniref:Ketoreductase (KR) domain-containing protein n=1 Tax=Aspergillus cristatus TaxID=573508 RepID=A0A1E3BHX0_ASPCR|nr:hypothetical protein SI65_03597 [Aspergillus cristatus]
MVDYSASKAAAVAFHEGLAAELITRYHAPRVRTVLVAQGFTRTGLIRNLTPEDPWFNPLLEPETVAEAVVDAVIKGRSGRIAAALDAALDEESAGKTNESLLIIAITLAVIYKCGVNARAEPSCSTE